MIISVPSWGQQHDDFERVPSAVRADDEPPVWVLPEILDGHRVVDGMEHVVDSHAVASGRWMDVHTQLLYYEYLPRRCGIPRRPTLMPASATRSEYLALELHGQRPAAEPEPARRRDVLGIVGR